MEQMTFEELNSVWKLKSELETENRRLKDLRFDGGNSGNGVGSPKMGQTLEDKRYWAVR